MNLENIYNFVSSTVIADGLAPLGARTSAVTVMAKFWSRVYKGPTLEWLIHNKKKSVNTDVKLSTVTSSEDHRPC